MTRVLGVIVSALILMGTAQAQTWFVPVYPIPPNPISVAAEIRPMAVRHNIDLREQWSKGLTQTRVDLSVTALIQGTLRVKYGLMPGFSLSDQHTPYSSFVVGSTEFGQAQQLGAAIAQQTGMKPVSLEWSWPAEHRVEVSLMSPRLPVKPLMIAQWSDLTISATGDKNGQRTTDTETWRKGVVGFGGVVQYATPGIQVSLQAVGGQGYSRAEGFLLWRISRNAAINAGYFGEQRTFENLKIRQQGPFVGLVWAF